MGVKSAIIGALSVALTAGALGALGAMGVKSTGVWQALSSIANRPKVKV